VASLHWRIQDYEIYVTPDPNDLDAFDAALEAAGYLDVAGYQECPWPLTDWWPADYARLRRTPAPRAMTWR